VLKRKYNQKDYATQTIHAAMPATGTKRERQY
jgi:hypothetical protein